LMSRHMPTATRIDSSSSLKLQEVIGKETANPHCVGPQLLKIQPLESAMLSSRDVRSRNTAGLYARRNWSSKRPHFAGFEATSLQLPRRVEYKLGVLVFKSLQGQPPPYIMGECQLISNDPGRCHLRSANANVCTVPRTSTRLGDRSFSVAGPRVWNCLPSTLRQLDMDFQQFE